MHQSFGTSSGSTNNLYNEYFANNEKIFRNETHTFDANHRLISTSKTFGITSDTTSQSDTTVNSYTFGSNNNVIEYKFGTKRTVASYDEQDRLLKLRGSISRDFTYNSDGDLEKISNCLGEKKFEYDEFSNLKKVTLPSGKVIEYKIDAFNRRVARLINGVVDKYYMWYDQTHLAAIFDKDRNMQQYYIWGINKFAPAIIVDLTNGRQYKVHSTLSGSVRHIVNYEGKVIQEIEYDELGMITKDTNPGFQPFGYNGGLWDPETKLVRFGARDYDPSVSRWTTKDPIGFNGGDTNLYGYVANDPVNFVDPRGLWSVSLNLFAVLGGGATVGRNPDGSLFGSLRGGVGAGGGLSWDPKGQSPAYGTCANSGLSVGQYAEGGVHFGPMEFGANINSGTSVTNGSQYANQNPAVGVNPSIGVGVGVSGGFEFNFGWH